MSFVSIDECIINKDYAQKLKFSIIPNLLLILHTADFCCLPVFPFFIFSFTLSNPCYFNFIDVFCIVFCLFNIYGVSTFYRIYVYQSTVNRCQTHCNYDLTRENNARKKTKK